MTKQTDRKVADNLAKGVRIALAVANASPSSMASKMGIAQSTMYYRINSPLTWRVGELLILSKLCGCTLQELLEGSLK